MSDQPALAKSERLLSLDVLRGMTIAGMILVNNPGDWGHIYGPLGHAKWNGWTPTDLVFPFFLFMVGVALTFSFDRRLAQTHSKAALLTQVVRRTIILFSLGLLLTCFPNWRLMGPYVLLIAGSHLLLNGPRSASALGRAIGAVLFIGAIAWWARDFAYFQGPNCPFTGKSTVLRVPGVLQRIALCYFFASIIVMTCGVRGRVMWAGGLIIGYWLLVKYASPPASYVPTFAGRPEGLLHDWIDVRLLGAHLYSERPDPEGLLSTIGGLATTLLGVLAGNWLHTTRGREEKAAGMFFAANLALFIGLCLDYSMPINKKIWTSSYVLVTGGLALNMLAMCYWLIDVKGVKVWAWPFMVFGTNAILVYFAAGIFGRILAFTSLTTGEGKAVTLKAWLYQHSYTDWLGTTNKASLAWAVSYVLLWLLLMTPLYRRRLFVKI